jgi:hypothetical protein
MMANAAFLAALTVFLLAAWLAGEVSYLAPYKAELFRRHGRAMGIGALLLFLNLCAAYYRLGRWLFLRDTGRKLLHVDRQLTSRDAVIDDLRDGLNS